MKKAVKITLITAGAIVGALGITVASLFGYSAFYSIPKQAQSIENTTGHVIAKDRSLYDEDGNKLVLQGVNFGNLFLQEDWISPFALEPKKNDDGSYVKDKDGNIQYPEFNEEQFREGLYANPNCGKENYDEWFDYYFHTWVDDSDYQTIKSYGLNCIRLPFYWKNILNDDLNRKEEDKAFYYIDQIVEKAKENDLYVILDLHGAPGSQNGHEHSGYQEVGASLWDSEEYINATADLWKYVSEHYKTTRNDLSSTIASFDLVNEPQISYDGSTTKKCWDAMDKFYDAIRDNGDPHMISIEGCWTFDKLPNPKKYGWENIQYEYHWYNFSHSSIPYNLYYTYQDLFHIGRDYNVPIYIGEFTFFNEVDAWEQGFELFEKRGYSWTFWTFKGTTVGWWNTSWALLTTPLYNDVETEELKCNISTCTFEEFKAACDKCTSDKGQTSEPAEALKKYNNL